MVKGLFTTKLQFPYTQFASTKLTSDSLFQLFWKIVKRIGLVMLLFSVQRLLINFVLCNTLHDRVTHLVLSFGDECALLLVSWDKST